MKELIKRTFAPIFSLLIIMMGTGFFNTFVSYRIADLGHTDFLNGFIYSCYYFGILIGAVYIERLINITGHIRAFAIFAALCSSSVLLQGYTVNPFIWVIFRFILGFGCAGLFIVIESWLLLLSSNDTRGKILSIYMLILYAAQATGQWLLTTLDLSSTVPFSFTAFFCSLSIIPVCLMRANAPINQESEYINIFYILKKTPLGFFANIAGGLVVSSFYSLGPVFAKNSGLSLIQISTFMSVTIFGGMALQWPIGLLSDIFERRKVLATTALTLALLSGILYFVTQMPFFLFIVLSFLYGGLGFTLYPLAITYCCDFFSPAAITAITCASLVIYGIGCILGPLTVPFFMQIETTGFFLFTSIIASLLTIFSIYRIYKLPHESKEMKEKFTALPPTPNVGDLDPRTEKEETDSAQKKPES